MTINMTAFITLQPATGQEMSRRDYSRDFDDIELEAWCASVRASQGAGYVMRGGRIVAVVCCRTPAAHETEPSESSAKWNAKRMIWDWGNARVNGRKKP